MSMHLYWEPAHTPPAGDLSDSTKFVIRERYGAFVDVIVDSSDAAYLQGIRDAGSKEVKKDAQALLDAIEKYGAIRIFEM